MKKILGLTIGFVLIAALVLGVGFSRPALSANAARNAYPYPPPNPTPKSLYLPAVMEMTKIKIGLLLPMTGPVSGFGQSAQHGVQMAVDEWNSKGGLLGRKITTVLADGQCRGDVASDAATRLINDDKVHYIIGEVCSSASIPVSVIAQNNGVVMISPVSTNLNVTIKEDGTVKPYIFRACFVDPFQGSAMAGFAMQQGKTKAFLLYDSGDDYSSSLANWFEDAFKTAGGTIEGKEVYPNGPKSLSDILDEVKSSNADVLFLPYIYDPVNQIATAVKDKGITAVMMGGDGWEYPALDLTATEGSFYSTHFAVQNPDPFVQDWVTKYRAIYGQDPDSIAALGYDAAYLLFNAIQAANQDDPALVKDTLAAEVYQGVTGNISFDSHHNPQKPVVVMYIHNNTVSFYAKFP